MSICNSIRQLKILAGLSSSLLLVACFDVENVDVAKPVPQRLLVEDFEDRDLLPNSPLFGASSVFTFSLDQQKPTQDFALGFDSKLAVSLTFALQSPPSEPLEGIGVGFAIPAKRGTLDLRSYRNLHVDAKLELDDQAASPGTIFQVGFACDSVPHPPGVVDGGFTVTNDSLIDAFGASGNWRSITIALPDLEQPAWQLVRFNQSDCTKRVDAIFFNVGIPFASNQHAAGTLMLDNVYLD